MLLDIREQLDDPVIRELIEYAIFPDPERVERALEDYKTNQDLEIYAWEEEGAVVGVIGIRIQLSTMVIELISVEPVSRRLGYGRGLILELLERKQPEQIVAETDDEAVDFYRNIGFTITSLGEKYPGVERFMCVYEV